MSPLRLLLDMLAAGSNIYYGDIVLNSNKALAHPGGLISMYMHLR